MANKKRKRPRPRPVPPASGVDTPSAEPRTGASPERRERKQLAREARERARKQAARRDAVRRAGVFLAIGVVALVAFWFMSRVGGPGELSEEASALASDAGCSDVVMPAEGAIERDHLDAGQDANYTEHPATSGRHDASTLGTSTKVFDEPVREEQAVHSMEHGGVILYYRNDGSVRPETIDGLESIALERAPVFASPLDTLDDGVDIAFTAWNTLLTCPAGMPAADAVTIAESFADAFACTSRAPEAGTSDELC